MIFNHFKANIFKYKKTSFLIGFFLLVIVGYLLFSWLHSTPMLPPDNKIVEVEPVKKQSLHETARFIGTIRSEQATTLIAKSKGILDRFVSSGQHVKKGDLIAKIDNQDIEHNFKLTEEMEQIAKQQFERFQQLNKQGVISPNDLEEKKSVWIQSQKNKSDAKIVMDEINIYAPFDGIVGIFKIREGSQVQEGDTIVGFYDPATTIVEFDVPLNMMNLIHDGSSVFIDQKEYPLTHIQKMLDEDTHMSPAYVNIQCENCIIGSTVDVNLVVREKKSILVIPHEAVFLRESKPFVYRVVADKAVLTPVELGIREKEEVEITKGLNEMDLVVIRGQARLYPNAPVKIQSKPSKS